ncbi:Type 1 glutamine amidotransferase-like domain-containing protein [Microlunatus antarcticus]|nr:peptidase E [Microlunatus antarcticus]
MGEARGRLPVVPRHVVALGGGGFLSGDDRALDDAVLALADRDTPRVAYVGTASGDPGHNEDRFRDAFTGRARPSVLRLFDREVADLDAFLAEQDVVYVGGGSTVNLLAVWRAHGLDAALRRAYEAGVVMAGVSAGANCWFGRSTTDSWLVGRADGLTDGLGWLPGGMCPHYRSEPSRRPALLDLVADGFGDTYGVDDDCGLHFVDEQLVGAISARAGAQAVLVRRGDDGRVVEEPVSAADAP